MSRLEINVSIDNHTKSDEFNIAISFIFKFVLYIYQYRKNILYIRDVKEYFS